ncbi:MAG TPA: hypothetical protein VN420_01520 [Candidatus Fimivivens sp.]|nr:hypothetical protein [Candidatus Fimivivens sp.]
MKKEAIIAQLTRTDRNPYGLAIALNRGSSGIKAVIGFVGSAETAILDGKSMKFPLPWLEANAVIFGMINEFRVLSTEEMSIFKVRRWLDRVAPDEYLTTLATYLHTAPPRDTFANVFEWFKHPSRDAELIRGALCAGRLTIIVLGTCLREQAEICLYVDGVGSVTLSDGDGEGGQAKYVPKWLRDGAVLATTELGTNLVRDWTSIPIQEWADQFKKEIRFVVYECGDTPTGIVKVGERTVTPGGT